MIEVFDIAFHRSSFCNAGACIEVGFQTDGRAVVRNSGRPDLAVQIYASSAWTAFLAAVRAGEFDH